MKNMKDCVLDRCKINEKSLEFLELCANSLKFLEFDDIVSSTVNHHDFFNNIEHLVINQCEISDLLIWIIQITSENLIILEIDRSRCVITNQDNIKHLSFIFVKLEKVEINMCKIDDLAKFILEKSINLKSFTISCTHLTSLFEFNLASKVLEKINILSSNSPSWILCLLKQCPYSLKYLFLQNCKNDVLAVLN